MNLFHRKNRKIRNTHIDPDEIFLDATNLPGFDTFQFEGRIEKPIPTRTFFLVGAFFLAVVLIFLGRTWFVQISQGEKFAEWSANNRLRYSIVFSDRGIIYDRNGVALAWNEASSDDFTHRKYITDGGFANLLGYVSYPKKDSSGFYYDTAIEGVSGIEEHFNSTLQQKNGQRIIETDALNNVVSGNIMRSPEPGKNIELTIDSEIQHHLFKSIEQIVTEAGFIGASGVLMDARSGELLALASFPEYDSNILTEGDDDDAINDFIKDERNPFLNRPVDGLYTPGSIMKPYVAIGALQEGVISATDKIISRGSISIPNPYNPDNPSVFNDWKAHGPVDVREALAYSSNVYFYEVGGGYKDIEGLGISRIEEYFRKFGFGQEIPGGIFSGSEGTIPNPEWKEEIFDDIWRLGDTYFTAIGQYGVQVTPLQVARALSAIATKGDMVQPQIIKDDSRTPEITKVTGIDDFVWDTVQKGMRDVVEFGTAKGLNYSDIEIAAKTGTAELGVSKSNVNSSAVGFFPYQDPKYVFVILMESGSRSNLIGGVAASRLFFDWLKVNRPEMFE